MARNKLAYPQSVRIQARALRIVSGESLKVIAGLTGISKSTASLWLRNIELTEKQRQRLYQRELDNRFGGKNRTKCTTFIKTITTMSVACGLKSSGL